MASGFKVNGTDLSSLLAARHAGWPTSAATGILVGGSDLNALFAPSSSGSNYAGTTNFKHNGSDIGVTLQQFASLGSTTVQAFASPASVSGSSAPGTGVTASSITTSYSQIFASKGSGNYTYTWTNVVGSGNGTLYIEGGYANGTANSSGAYVVSTSVPPATTYSGTMECTVSDGTTSIIIPVSWSNSNTSAAFISHTDIYQGPFNANTLGTAFPSGITITVPTGASHLLVRMYAPGGGGGCNTTGTHPGGGGGEGAYFTASSTIAVTPGQTFIFKSGFAGIGGNQIYANNDYEYCAYTINGTQTIVSMNYLNNTSTSGTAGGGTTRSNPASFMSTTLVGQGALSGYSITLPAASAGKGGTAPGSSNGGAGAGGSIGTYSGFVGAMTAGSAGSAGTTTSGGNGANPKGTYPYGSGLGYTPSTGDNACDNDLPGGGGGSTSSPSPNGYGGLGSSCYLEMTWS